MSGMRHVNDHIAFDQMGILDQLGRTEDRAGRHFALLKMRHRFLDRVLSNPGLDYRVDIVTVLHALLKIGESGIVEQVFAIQGSEQTLPVLGRDRTDGHIAVLGMIDVEWHPARMRIPPTFRSQARGHMLNQVWQQEERAVLHGGIDPLAATRFFAQLERGQNPDQGEQGGRGIADRGPAPRRRMVRKAGDAVDAAGSLNDRIVGPPVAAWPVLAKARNRAQNNAWVTGAQGLIVEPHFVNRSRREILYHHVRLFH